MFVSEQTRYKIDKFFKSKRSITKMGWFIHTPGLSMMCGPMDQTHVTWFIQEHCHSDGNMVGFLFLTHFFIKLLHILTENRRWLIIGLLLIHPATNTSKWKRNYNCSNWFRSIRIQIFPNEEKNNCLNWFRSIQIQIF